MSIKCKCRQTGQIVFLINIIVGCLYKVNVFFLALVIDVLQLVKDLLGLLIALSICRYKIKCKYNKRAIFFLFLQKNTTT